MCKMLHFSFHNLQIDGSEEVPEKRFFSSYYHNFRERPKFAIKFPSWPKVEVTRQDPTFKSKEAVGELLAMSEDQMMEAIFQMEMTKAVSVMTHSGRLLIFRTF